MKKNSEPLLDLHVVSAVLYTARLTILEKAATTTGKRRRKALAAIDEKVAGAIGAIALMA
jgi:hypothetical protein